MLSNTLRELYTSGLPETQTQQLHDLCLSSLRNGNLSYVSMYCNEQNSTFCQAG